MSKLKRYKASKTYGDQLVDMLRSTKSVQPQSSPVISDSEDQNSLVENASTDPIQNDCEHTFLNYDTDFLNSSESESDESEPTRDSFIDELRSWFVESNISNAFGNNLLKILRKRIDGLPKDVRTLKKTPKDAPTISLTEGEYVHYGLKDCLTDFLSQNSVASNQLELNINLDGLPVSKSSRKNIWPILVNVNGTDPVLVVGIYSVNTHPKFANEFLQPFVEELNHLYSNGLEYKSKVFSVKCRSFVCDAPARAFILGVKHHSGYNSCTKCVQKGTWNDNRVTFPLARHSSRTDEDFRNKTDPPHHRLYSILEKLPIDIVKD